MADVTGLDLIAARRLVGCEDTTEGGCNWFGVVTVHSLLPTTGATQWRACREHAARFRNRPSYHVADSGDSNRLLYQSGPSQLPPWEQPEARSAATMGAPTREDGAASTVKIAIDLGLKGGAVGVVMLPVDAAVRMMADLAVATRQAQDVNSRG